MKKIILHLTLKKKWFDQIAQNKKKWEYRKTSPYWLKRFTYVTPLYSGHSLHPKQFDEIHFRNGYTKDKPFMRVEWKGLQLKEFEGDVHFAIKLGKILEIKNWKKTGATI